VKEQSKGGNGGFISLSNSFDYSMMVGGCGMVVAGVVYFKLVA
jgi:hypothetical protein